MSIKEVTGLLPLVVSPSDGTPLLDWHIKGAAGGVGKVDTNKLNYKSIAEGEMTNNVNPEKYPDVFGYIYTLDNASSANVMNRTSIPNGAANAEYQHWYRMICPYNDYWHRMNDYRAKTYSWCNWKGHLAAGTYKLVVECANPYRNYLPQNNPNPTMIDEKGYYALLNSDNNVLVEVKWDEFFTTADERPTWTRKETEFTISESVDVGVLAKMYYPATSSLDVAWRYMIVPADTPNTQFSVTTILADSPIISGESCWEPYKVTLPLTITHGEQSTAISIDLGTEFLGENDTVDFTTTHITIPTYSGANTITADTDIQPSEMYAKFSTSGTVYIRRNGVWEQELTPHRYENQVWSDISEKERENGEWVDKS